MTDQRAGGSTLLCDFIVKHQLEEIAPKEVVDFGPGAGKYGRMIREVLPKGCVAVAVEGYKKTAEMLSENGWYDEIHHSLLQAWIAEDSRHFDVAIFGDVLEHLTSGEIHQVMKKCIQKFDHIIIVAPLHEIFQDTLYENSLEIHKTYMTSRFFDRYDPIEKNIVRGKDDEGNDWTIMNVHIVVGSKRDPFYRRTSKFVFHLCMMVLQPVGLARPFVDFLTLNLARYKWLLRG